MLSTTINEDDSLWAKACFNQIEKQRFLSHLGLFFRLEWLPRQNFTKAGCDDAIIGIGRPGRIAMNSQENPDQQQKQSQAQSVMLKKHSSSEANRSYSRFCWFNRYCGYSGMQPPKHQKSLYQISVVLSITYPRRQHNHLASR
jgi:hypothetical protein